MHALWLRERTRNPDHLHVPSKQRLFEASDLLGKAGGIVERAVVSQSGQLHVHYTDGFEDTLDLQLLLAEARDGFAFEPFSANPSGPAPPIVSLASPEPKYWGEDTGGAFSLDTVTHRYADLAASVEGMYAFQHDLLVYGAALVKDSPGPFAQYQTFLQQWSSLRQTNWGRWFEVVAKPEATAEEGASLVDAAYSSLGIPLHTDGPYNENPLLYQVLQCLKQSAVGGESTLSDGAGAAQALRLSDPEAFDILCETPVRFRYADETNELVTDRPMINLGRTGRVERVFFSGRLDATPIAASIDETERFYRAKSKFLAELYSPSKLINFKLAPGDMLVFSNTRLLHGRSEFVAEASPQEDADPSNRPLTVDCKGDGPDLRAVSRYLRGCYVEDVGNRFRVSVRRVAAKRASTRGFCTARPAASSAHTGPSCSFTQLKDCTAEDVALMSELYTEAATGDRLAERALELFNLLNRVQVERPVLGINDTHLGVKIDLYEHGLQTATRAYRDGATEEVVVAALLHDLGELLSPSNHGEFSAALLRPFVSPHVSWMLEHHEVFQMYYYNAQSTPPRDPNLREKYLSSSRALGGEVDAYEFTVNFCEKYDQASFDPEYQSMDVSEFEPLVRNVFNRDAYWHTPDHPKRGAVTG